VCSVRCVSGNDDCPSGFDCENTSGIDFYCIATPAPAPSKSKGGCACAMPPSAEGVGAWWTLAGLLAATRAKRRRPAP
jgi:MYXO-CTERM domain-containing protein